MLRRLFCDVQHRASSRGVRGLFLPVFSVAGLRLSQLDLSADLKPMGFSHDSFEGSPSCGSLIFFGDVSIIDLK